MTLLLAPDLLRVTRTSVDFGVDVRELQREEAGLLLRWSAHARSRFAEKLELDDLAGRDRIELLDRLVEVRTVISGGDVSAPGSESERVPLAVLVGSWWPDPELRATRVHPFRFAFAPRDRGDVDWGQPELDRYSAWQGRRAADEGLIFGAMGVLMVAVVVFATEWGPGPAPRGGSGWVALLPMVGYGGFLMAYGAWRLSGARRTLRRSASNPPASLPRRGILNRNG